MSTERKELIAIPDAVGAMNETALKRLAVMFNRVAIQALFVDPSKTPFLSPEFVKTRSWLADLGVLFDLDLQTLKSSTTHDYARIRELILEDLTSFTQPAYGMTSEEFLATRNDEEKASEMRRRGAETSQAMKDKQIDPSQMIESALRLSTNMWRMVVGQLRDAENAEAYLVTTPELNTFESDDPRQQTFDVLKISIGALPVPVADAPWQQLIEYRNDPETKDTFHLIKDWMSEVARATFTPSQVEETLEYLLDRFRRSLETHGINTTTTALYAYVVTTPEFIETLARVGPDWGQRALFSVEPGRIGLMDCESTTPGSVVAFLLSIDVGISLEELRPSNYLKV